MTNEELYHLPASELLKHIQDEKEHLIKEKIIKKSKPLPPIKDEEKSYELPEGWEWIRLGEVVNCEDYKRIPISVKDRNFLEKKYRYYGSTGVIDYVDSFIFDGYYLLVGEDGADFIEKKKPVSFIATGQFWANNHVHILSSFFNTTITYLSYYLNTINYENIITGTAQKKLNQERLLNILIPLPPLYIQDQIVQKLEQLSEIKDSLLSHAESQLNYTKKMREALLQEAIRGELVPQDENVEPASILLEKIKAEKDRLIKEKVIKKQKELPPITEEEKPYELPVNWEWVRLGELITLADNLNIQSKLNPEDRINYLDIDSIDNSNQTIKGVKVEPVKNLSTRARRVLKKDMIVYSMVRPYLKNMAIITEDKENYIGSTGFIAFNSIFVKKEYIFNFLRSDYTTNILNSYITGFNSPSINMDQFNELCIPLPPLAEQERIVAKLDELMANCDQLEMKAEEMKNYTSKLFEASLKEAFAPE